MKPINFIIVCALSIMFGCTKPTTSPNVETESQGKFALAQIQVPSVSSESEIAIFQSVQNTSSQNTNFNLGEIRNTTDFYFTLSNVGNNSITDITLISANPNFIITPAKIDTLHPSSALRLLQVIKVIAIHGTSESRVGSAPVMAIGENKTVLTIRGKTKGTSSNSIDLSEAVEMKLEAKLANLRVQDSIFVADLSRSSGLSLIPASLTPVPFFTLRGSSAWVVNTGNVPLTVETIRTTNSEVVSSVNLRVGDSTRFPLLVRNIVTDSLGRVDSSRFITFNGLIRVNTNNTIADMRRFPMLRNGNLEFILSFRN
jgi:hypothetical protein